MRAHSSHRSANRGSSLIGLTFTLSGRGEQRERLYAGNRETLRNALLARDGIPWWVIRTHGKRRRDFPELLRRPDYRHAAVIQLDRPAAAEAFLLAVSAGPGTTNSGHTHAD